MGSVICRQSRSYDSWLSSSWFKQVQYTVQNAGRNWAT